MPVLLELFPHDREGYDEEWIVRLFRGLATAAHVRHPNVAVLYDLGRREGYDFVIRELADGGSVRARLEKEGAMPLKAALPLAEDMLRALRVAERRGVHCGRISPDTVLLDYDGSAKLNQFGRPYHRLDLREFQLTRSNKLTGPCFYVAPEQARNGLAGDVRSDLFSLGATLYEMVCGRRPYQEASAEVMLARRAEENPPAPAIVNADLPPEVCAFIENAMATAPRDRPQSAEEALDRLRQVARTINARPELHEAPAMAREEKESEGRIKAVLWTVLAFMLVGLAIVPLYRLAREGDRTDERLLEADAPDPAAGRVLVVLNPSSDAALDAASVRAVLTMVGVKVGEVAELTPVDPFLTDGMLRDEVDVDRILLETDPAYVLRLREETGGKAGWTLSFASVKGDDWREEYGVPGHSFRALKEGVETLLVGAAEKMGVSRRVPTQRDLSLEIWSDLGSAVAAERADRWEDARDALERVAGRAGGKLPPVARVLDAYYVRAIGGPQGDVDSSPAQVVPDGLTGEFAALAAVPRAIQGGGETAVRRALADYIADRPGSPRGYYLLGLWRSRTNRPVDEALAAFRRAIRADPGYMPAVHEAARLLHREDGRTLRGMISRYRELAWSEEQVRAVETYCAQLKGRNPRTPAGDSRRVGAGGVDQ
jgi:hypothetical protein